MNAEDNVKTVFRYYEGCNSGDIEQMMGTFTPDVVHYFLPEIHPPIRGAEHLARYWRKFYRVFQPVWRIDHSIAAGDEVVIEWSCAYVPRDKDRRMMFRGTEWFVMRSGLIAEVRAYYGYDEARDCELTGFPYSEREYLSKDRLPPSLSLGVR